MVIWLPSLINNHLNGWWKVLTRVIPASAGAHEVLYWLLRQRLAAWDDACNEALLWLVDIYLHMDDASPAISSPEYCIWPGVSGDERRIFSAWSFSAWSWRQTSAKRSSNPRIFSFWARRFSAELRSEGIVWVVFRGAQANVRVYGATGNSYVVSTVGPSPI